MIVILGFGHLENRTAAERQGKTLKLMSMLDKQMPPSSIFTPGVSYVRLQKAFQIFFAGVDDAVPLQLAGNRQGFGQDCSTSEDRQHKVLVGVPQHIASM